MEVSYEKIHVCVRKDRAAREGATLQYHLISSSPVLAVFPAKTDK